MPIFFTIILSFIIYFLFFRYIFKPTNLLKLFSWPKDKTLLMFWLGWLGFLFIFAPLSYLEVDMNVWVESIKSLLVGKSLPFDYVYFPIFAQLNAAIAWPFHFLGLSSDFFLTYIVNGGVILAYMLSAKFMADFLVRDSQLAPLAIVLAPVVIFNLFLGSNHIMMFLFILISLILIKKEKWFWAGFFAFLSTYKFLMLPTLLVLLVIVYLGYGWKKTLRFLLGGFLFILPNLVYYLFYPDQLIRIINEKAAIGGRCQHLDPFHFLYYFKYRYLQLEHLYIAKKIWFYLSMVAVGMTLFFYKIKRFTLLQSLAFISGIIAILALEPFRLEPMIGLLWLDGVYRKDLLTKTAVFLIIFTFTAAWYPDANSGFLVFSPQMPLNYWLAKGLLLGLVIMFVFLIILFQKDKRDMFIGG